jgi:cellulose synthase/poly-beta-1,6-N-acetylglucosamine synthase-like glycosyltransferase
MVMAEYFHWLPNMVDVVLIVVGVFFVGAHVSYALLLLFSWIQVRSRQLMRQKLEREFHFLSENMHLTPSVTIIMPAYNEAKLIEQSVRSFLDLDYENYQVFVINDGSRDDTLHLLHEAFQLEPCELEVCSKLGSSQVKGTYRSAIYKNLRVIDQCNGGKASALNTGIRYANTDLVCCVDADTIPERDCLLRTVLPFVESCGFSMDAG